MNRPDRSRSLENEERSQVWPTYQAQAARVERSESRVCFRLLLGGAVLQVYRELAIGRYHRRKENSANAAAAKSIGTAIPLL